MESASTGVAPSEVTGDPVDSASDTEEDDTSNTPDDGSSGNEDSTGTSGDTAPGDGTDESSGGTPELSPLVQWGELLDAAAIEAAAINPSAELSLVAARGVRADGTVDLSDAQTDGFVEFRFWQEGADTGVTVSYGIEAYSAEADALMPAAYPVNGNAFESAIIWDVAGLPTFAEVAAGFGAAAGCGGFTGDAEDRISMRVDWFSKAFVEVRADTATTSSTADAATLAFVDCS